MKAEKRITIEKMVTGGFGLGRIADGKIVLVPYVLPGEDVLLTVAKQRKSYLEAHLLQILQPSPSRIEPVCKYYRKCGGCDFQHIEGHAQLAIKQEILNELLRRSGNLQHEKIEEVMETPLASPLLFGYRQRIRLQIDHRGNCLGFYRPRSHTVEPITVLSAR